jgi:hypothetical protein
MESDTTKKWSSTVISCRKLRCTVLQEDEQGLKFTRLDNKIRALYLEKDTFLPVDRHLFHVPLLRVLAKSARTKEAHLLEFKAAKQRLEAFNYPENLENVINLNNRKKQKKQAKQTNKDSTITTTTKQRGRQ